MLKIIYILSLCSFLFLDTCEDDPIPPSTSLASGSLLASSDLDDCLVKKRIRADGDSDFDLHCEIKRNFVVNYGDLDFTLSSEYCPEDDCGPPDPNSIVSCTIVRIGEAITKKNGQKELWDIRCEAADSLNTWPLPENARYLEMPELNRDPR